MISYQSLLLRTTVLNDIVITVITLREALLHEAGHAIRYMYVSILSINY